MSDVESNEYLILPNLGTGNIVPDIVDLTLDTSEEEGKGGMLDMICEYSGDNVQMLTEGDPLNDVTVIKVVSFIDVHLDDKTITIVTEGGEELADNPETSSRFCMNSRIETESVCDSGSKSNMLPTELPDPVQNETSRYFDMNMPVLKNDKDYCALPNGSGERDMPLSPSSFLKMDADRAKPSMKFSDQTDLSKNIFGEETKIWNADCSKDHQMLQQGSPAGSDASKPKRMKFTKTMSTKSCHPGRDQRGPEVLPLVTAQQNILKEPRDKYMHTNIEIQQTKNQKLSKTMSRNSPDPEKSVSKGPDLETHQHAQQNNLEELRNTFTESDAETEKKNGHTKTHERTQLKDMQQDERKVQFSSALSEITCPPSAVLTVDEPVQHLVTAMSPVVYEKLLQAVDIQNIGYFCDKCSILFSHDSQYRAHMAFQGQCSGSSDVLTTETTHCGSGTVVQMMEVQKTSTQTDSVSRVSVDDRDDAIKSHHNGMLGGSNEYLNDGKKAAVWSKGSMLSVQVLQTRETSAQPTLDKQSSKKLLGRISGESASGTFTGLDVGSPGMIENEHSSQLASEACRDIWMSGDNENKLKHSPMRKQVCQSDNLCSQDLKGSQEKHGNPEPGGKKTYGQQAFNSTKKLSANEQVLSFSKPLGKRGRKKKVQTRILPEVEVEEKKYQLRPRTQASCTGTALNRAVGEQMHQPQSKTSVSCTRTPGTVVDVEEDFASRHTLFYVCGSKCGYTTLFHKSFKVHVEECLLLGSLSCIHCGFKGMTLEDLTSHMEAHLEQYDKMFRCTEESCGFYTDILKVLKAHLVDGHRGLASYRCCVCEIVCQDLGSLVHHLEDNLVQVAWCRYCDAVTCDLEVIQKHGQEAHPSKQGHVWTMDRLLCADRKRNGALGTYPGIPAFEPVQGRMVETSCKNTDPSVKDVRICETKEHFSLDSTNAGEGQVCFNEELFHDLLSSHTGYLSAGDANIFRSDIPSQQSLDEEVDNDVAEESDMSSEVNINLSLDASDLDCSVSGMQSTNQSVTSTESDCTHTTKSVTSTESNDGHAVKSVTSSESDDRHAVKSVTSTESDDRHAVKSVTSTESDDRHAVKSVTSTESDDRHAVKSVTSTESDDRHAVKSVTSTESDDRHAVKSVTSTESDDRHAVKSVTSTESDDRHADISVTSTDTEDDLACEDDVIDASGSMEKDSIDLIRGNKQKKTMTIPDGEYFTKALKCIACVFSSMSRKNFERHLKSCHPEIHIVVESSCSPSSLEVKQYEREEDVLEDVLLWLYEDHDTCYVCCICKRVICVKTVLHCHLLGHLKVNLGHCVVCHEITCLRPEHRKSIILRTPRYIVEETKRSVQVLLGSVEQNGVPVFNLKPCLGTEELREKLEHLSTFCRKRFHCSVCLSCHVTLYSIHKHILLKHLNMPPFTCGACDFSGSERYEVARHMHNQHPSEPLCLKYSPVDDSRHSLFDVPGKRLHRKKYVLVSPDGSHRTSADRFLERRRCKRMIIRGKERGSQRRVIGTSHYKKTRQNRKKGSSGNDNDVLGEHQCSCCSFRTRLLKLLIEHKKERHPLVEILNEDMEKETSGWCGKMEVALLEAGYKSSVSGDPMDTHVKSYYKCQTCNFRSESSDESIKHLRSKKPVKMIIQCSHCPAVFGQTDTFTRHVDLHHKQQNYKYIQIPLEAMVEEVGMLKVKVRVYRCVFCSYRSVMRARFETHLACHVCCITGNL